MSIFDMNDALQRATSPHTWICWHPVFDGCRHVDERALLCNCRSHAELGLESEGLDALLARLPETEGKLRWS